MKVEITIECFDKEEFFEHLTAIRNKVRNVLPRHDKDTLEFEDNNCYGTHDVKIEL